MDAPFCRYKKSKLASVLKAENVREIGPLVAVSTTTQSMPEA